MTTRFFRLVPMLLAVLLLFAMNFGSGSIPSVEAAPAAQTGWVLKWSDEFNGALNTQPSSANWNFETGGHGWGNNELQYYTGRPENVSMDGAGNLRIMARTDGSPYQCHYGTCRYTSARITTAGKVQYQYGRIEARLKLPTGQGLWPAFWMLGNDIGTVGWPQCGEIDIMENKGSQSMTTSSALHGPGYSGATPINHSQGLSSSVTNYHVYAVEWSATEFRFYVDSTLHYTVPKSTVQQYGNWVYDHPHFVILNLAVGGHFDGNPGSDSIFPATVLVDYVRIYQLGTVSGDGNPYSGTPVAVPGTVQAENFNTGGQGVAYNDAEAANQGGQYRTGDGVDIEISTDTNGGHNVGWTAAGEWLKYTVNVQTSGTYNLNFRVASATGGGTFHLEVGGTNVTGTLTIPNTGGWQTWTTVTKTGVNLTAGQRVFRLVIDSAGGNINWLSVTSGGTSPTATRTPTRTNTPGGPAPTATRTPTRAPSVPTNTPSSGTPAWAPNTSYAVNQLVTYGGLTYKCLQAHTSLVGWEPPNVPALWARV